MSQPVRIKNGRLEKKIKYKNMIKIFLKLKFLIKKIFVNSKSWQHWSSHGAGPYFLEHIEEIHSGNIPERYQRITKFVKGPTVIDIGCGEGLLPLALANKQKVLGIDASEKRIDIAKKLQKDIFTKSKKNVFFKCKNATDLILKDNHDCKVIVFNRSLYHFEEDIHKILNAIKTSKSINELVLVGHNDKRNMSPTQHRLGEWIKYSQIKGMIEVFNFLNYKYDVVRDDINDPIVHGIKNL